MSWKWANLADPDDRPQAAATVTVSGKQQKPLSEIVGKHSQEPWELVVGTELAEKIANGQLEDNDYSKLISKLEAECRRTLDYPLVLAYVCKIRGKDRSQRWALIGRTGVLLILSGKRGKYHLVTAYFLNQQRDMQSDRPLWMLNAEYFADRYTYRESALLGRLPRQDVSVEHSVSKVETRSEIRFITPQNWGFERGSFGNVWSGTIPPWDDDLTIPDANEQRFKPRYHRKQAEDNG